MGFHTQLYQKKLRNRNEELNIISSKIITGVYKPITRINAFNFVNQASK